MKSMHISSLVVEPKETGRPILLVSKTQWVVSLSPGLIVKVLSR